MKRILTVFSLCLLLGVCLFLFACPGPQGVTVQSVQADPVEALNSAIEKASSGFVADETGVIGILSEAIQKGSYGISADLTDMLGVSFDYVGYNDMAAKRMLQELDLTLAGTTLRDMKFYMDPEGMTIDAPAFLGYQGALRFDLDTAGNLFDPSYEQSPAGISMIETLKLSMASMFETDPTQNKEIIAEIFNTLGYQATETTYEGEEVVQLTIKITTDKFIDCICNIIDDTPYDAETKAEAKAGLREEFAELALSVNVAFHIQKSSGMLMDAVATGSFAMDTYGDPNEPDAMEFTLVYKTSKTEISILATLSAVEGGIKSESGSISLSVKKATEGSKLSYTTKLDLTMNDVTFHVGSIIFDYDKSTSDYALTIKAGAFLLAPDLTSSVPDGTLTLSGKLQKTGNKVTLTADKFVMKNFGPSDSTVPLRISIFFEKGVSVPAAPANPKDITTLSEAEMAAIEQYVASLFPQLG